MSFRDDQVLNEVLRFRPWPNGDPGPEIYTLVQEELSSAERREFLSTLVGIEAAMTEARLGGLKQIQGLLAGRKG